MPPLQLKDIQAAVHKTAAGMAARKPAAEVGSATGGPSVVAQDLAVMADQAATYRKGQAAGNQQAEAERGQVTEGLATERAQSDQARTEELEAQRRKMAEIELERRANEERAAQESAALKQRVAIERAEASARASAARAARARQAAEDAADAEREKEAARMARVTQGVARRYSDNFQTAFSAVINSSPTYADAQEAMKYMEKAGTIGRKPHPTKSIVSRDILDKELRRLYGVGGR